MVTNFFPRYYIATNVTKYSITCTNCVKMCHRSRRVNINLADQNYTSQLTTKDFVVTLSVILKVVSKFCIGEV